MSGMRWVTIRRNGPDQRSVQRSAVGSGERSAPRNQANGQGNAVARVAIQLDLEGVGPGLRQGEVEHQHRPGLDFRDPGRRLAEVHRSFSFKQRIPPIIDEPDGQAVLADFGAPPAHPQDEMGPRMHRRELGHPHMLKQAQDGKLPLLVDQGVVGEDGKIEQQVRSPGSR